MRTRIYYRGPDAVVTEEHFIWQTSPVKRFAIRDITNVGIVRGDTAGLRPHSAQMAGGGLVVVAATSPAFDAPLAVAVGVLAVGLPAAAAIVAWRLRSRTWELRASYRGQEVVLYASIDGRVFNQVCRALLRAMEDSRPPSTSRKLVA